MFNPTLIKRLCAGGLLIAAAAAPAGAQARADQQPIVFHNPAAHACAFHARHQHRTRENALAKFPGGTVRVPSRSGAGRLTDRC